MATASNPLQLATFNGTSQYASDIQQAINHAVTVASIPLTELGNNLTALQGQQSELSTLEGDFTSMQTAIQSLSSASAGSLAATGSNNDVATVSLDPSTALGAGTYTLNVISPGSQTITLSDAGSTVTDPTSQSISSSGSFTLSVNGTNTTITPAANTLDDLAQAINSANAGVSAVIVNLGSSASPDYRLSLQSTELGSDTIQLNDGTQPLLETLSTGADATYQVDGQPAPPADPISSTSSTVTIAPGLTAQLLQAGQTTITVAPDASSAENALSAFATAYNQAISDLGANHGTSGGALTGQPIVFQLQQSLEDILQYSGGSGSVKSLTDLGLTFSQSGQLTFDSSTFESIQASDPGDVASFLGSSSGSGSGFLGAATNALNGLTDPTTGLFTTTNSSYQSQITKDNSEISDTETRITNMQNTLVEQMSQADAAIATLEAQVSELTSLFQDNNAILTANG
jgi:flagellar hook-associated protein 2